MGKKLSKEEALQFCLDSIVPGMGEDYLKLRQYKFRAEKGELKDKAIQTLFDRFAVKDHCYYTIESPNDKETS